MRLQLPQIPKPQTDEERTKEGKMAEVNVVDEKRAETWVTDENKTSVESGIWKKIGAKAWSVFLMSSAIYGMLFVIFGHLAIPGKENSFVFTIFIMCVWAYVLSMGFGAFLSPEVGMLLAGVITRSMKQYQDLLSPEAFMSEQQYHLVRQVVWTILHVSLGVILFRVGMSLDLKVVWTRMWSVLVMALVPACLVEAPVVAAVSYGLIGWPIKFGFLLGFILAVSSPALVGNSLLHLNSKWDSFVNKEIYATVVASIMPAQILVSIAAVVPILESSFSLQPNGLFAPYWPLMSLGTICIGVLFGFILFYLPSCETTCTTETTKTSKCKLYALVVMAASILIMGEAKFMEEQNNIPVSITGSLAVVLFAAVLGRNSRSVDRTLKNWSTATWSCLQLPMFALMGYIALHVLVEGRQSWMNPDYFDETWRPYDEMLANRNVVSGGVAVAVISAGLVARLTSSCFIARRSGFTIKESLFIAISQIPKMSTMTFPCWVIWAMKSKEGVYDEVTSSILKVSAIAVLFTVPLGVIATKCGGIWLLERCGAEPAPDDPKWNKENPEAKDTPPEKV